MYGTALTLIGWNCQGARCRPDFCPRGRHSCRRSAPYGVAPTLLVHARPEVYVCRRPGAGSNSVNTSTARAGGVLSDLPAGKWRYLFRHRNLEPWDQCGKNCLVSIRRFLLCARALLRTVGPMHWTAWMSPYSYSGSRTRARHNSSARSKDDAVSAADDGTAMTEDLATFGRLPHRTSDSRPRLIRVAEALVKLDCKNCWDGQPRSQSRQSQRLD